MLGTTHWEFEMHMNYPINIATKIIQTMFTISKTIKSTSSIKGRQFVLIRSGAHDDRLQPIYVHRSHLWSSELLFALRTHDAKATGMQSVSTVLSIQSVVFTRSNFPRPLYKWYITSFTWLPSTDELIRIQSYVSACTRVKVIKVNWILKFESSVVPLHSGLIGLFSLCAHGLNLHTLLFIKLSSRVEE